MESMGIEEARSQLGEIIDRARLADQPTEITRQGKPAAVVISVDWYDAFMCVYPFLEWQAIVASLREARRTAGLSPRDSRTVHHKDGNPLNNDPANLEIVDPKENRP